MGEPRRYRAGQAYRYYPYGEEYTTTAQSLVKFATYYRDTNGLDYADQRFYRSIKLISQAHPSLTF